MPPVSNSVDILPAPEPPDKTTDTHEEKKGEG